MHPFCYEFLYGFLKSGLGEHGLTSWIFMELTTVNVENIEVIDT